MTLPPRNKLSEAVTKPAPNGEINTVHVKISRPKCIELVALAANIYSESPVNRLVFAAQAIRIIRLQYMLLAKSTFKDHDVVITLVLMNAHDDYYTSQQRSIINESIETINKQNKQSINNVRLLVLNTLEQVTAYINQGNGYPRQIFPIGRIDIFSHGFPNAIALGYGLRERILVNQEGYRVTPEQTLYANKETFSRWQTKAFCETASFYSWACQTGGVEKEGGKPLANHIADHLNIPVYTFIRRSDYAETWGSSDDRSYLKLQCNIPLAGDNKRCEQLEKGDEERQRNLDTKQVVWMKNGAVHPIKCGTTPEQALDGMFIFYPHSKEPIRVPNT